MDLETNVSSEFIAARPVRGHLNKSQSAAYRRSLFHGMHRRLRSLQITTCLCPKIVGFHLDWAQAIVLQLTFLSRNDLSPQSCERREIVFINFSRGDISTGARIPGFPLLFAQRPEYLADSRQVCRRRSELGDCPVGFTGRRDRDGVYRL
jgi:hypothetical protein